MASRHAASPHAGRRIIAVAGAWLVLLALAAPAASQPDATWSPAPPPQIEPRLFACDSLRDALLFQTRMGTIWSLAPGFPATWSVFDPSAPPGEPFLDPVRDRLIVIGRDAGSTLVASRPMSGGAWDSVRVAGVPAPADTWRVPGLMVYDAVRNRVVMCGTTDVFIPFPSFSTLTSETWVLALDGAPHWTQLVPTGTPPSGRRDANAIFDPVRVQLVLFGGDDRSNQLPQDTWVLTLGDTVAWKPLAVAGILPPGRVHAGTVYDPVGDQMMMLTGTDKYGSSVNDGFWVLPLAAPPEWSPLAVDLLDLAGQRSPRMVFDPRAGNVVIAGVTNINGSSRSATSGWTLTWYPQLSRHLLARHSEWPEQPPLWAREYAAAAYDGVQDRLLVFGGAHINNGTTGLADAWGQSLKTFAWLPFDPPMPGGVPPVSQQLFGSMVFDGVRYRMLRFETQPGFQVKTYAMDVSTAPSSWVPVNAGGVLPFGRDYPSFVFDPVHDRVLMFGGFSVALGYTNELWALSLAGNPPTWTLLAPSGPPPAGRFHAAAVYDSIGNRLVVHGGIIQDSPGVATDTWTCGFAGAAAWQPLSPAGAPPHPVFGNETNVSAIYDAIRQRMVVTAPETLGTRQGAWALSLGAAPAWTHLATAGPLPSARAAVAAAYDGRRDAMVMFGGRSVGLPWPDLNDTWFLDFPAPVLPEVTCPASMIWQAGSPVNFDVAVSPVLDQTVDWTLTCQRDWPGFPIAGTLDLHAGNPVLVPLSVAVPESAGFGLNRLVFTLTPRGAAATAVCSFHLHDAGTPTAGILVSALAAPGEVRLHWEAPDDAGPCTLERAAAQDAWRAIASVPRAVGGHFAYVDTDVLAGRYGYRVLVSGAPPSAETWVDVPAAARLALAGLQPNPAGGPVTVAFTLPDRAPVRLQVVDVAGRRVVDRTLEGLGPGVHVVRVDEARAIPAGVYFVRLIHGREVLTTRGAIVR